MNRLNILVSCYACSPYRGSEPGLGWNFIINLAEYHNLQVIVEQKWEKDISRYFQENPERKDFIQFHFIQKKHSRLLRKIWPPSYYYFYRMWQKKALEVSKDLMKTISIDMVHQLNMTGYREPGYLWTIQDKPFIWGPINGLNVTPFRILPIMGPYGAIFFFFRNIINLYQMNFMKRVFKAATRENNFLIASTPDIQEKILKYWHQKSIIVSEVGSIKRNISELRLRRVKSEPLKLVWSGLHIHRKALNILLHSLARLKDIDWELNILGAGNCTKKWKKLSKQLNISEKCIWHGWRPLSQSHEIMSSNHIFCFSSLSDTTATVLLEALSFGKPVICLKGCGYDHVIDENTGIKIEVKNPKQIYNDYSEAIRLLNDNEELRYKMGCAAIERAFEFSYQKNAKAINDIYITMQKKAGC